MEQDLLEAVHQSRADWMNASQENRELARRRFMDALRSFRELVLHDRIPKA